MKTIKYLFLPISFITFLLLLNGCDTFNSLPINMPITIKINATGSNQQIIDNRTFTLTENDTYKKYAGKFNQLTFLQASYRTTSITASGSPSTNVSGNLTIILKGNGVVLFTKTFTDIKPSDYISTPLVLQLNSAEIGAINDQLKNYLSDASLGTTFETEVNLQIFSQTSPPYTLVGAIDMVIEGDANLK